MPAQDEAQDTKVAGGPRWKPGDRILIEATVETVFDGPTNWPISIKLGSEASVNSKGSVHSTAIVNDSIAAAELRGYERGSREMFVRGVRAIGDLWSRLLGPIFKLRDGFEQIEGIHEALFNTVEGRAEDAPSLFDVPIEYWTLATDTWPNIKASIDSDFPLTPIARIRSAEFDGHAVSRAARDLVDIWTSPVYQQLTRSERIAAAESARRDLIEIVERVSPQEAADGKPRQDGA